jgi:HAMP domain-containing protein
MPDSSSSSVLVDTVVQSGGIAVVIVSALVFFGRAAGRFAERFVDRILGAMDRLAEAAAKDTTATTAALQTIALQLGTVAERLSHLEAQVTEVRQGATPPLGRPTGGGYGPMRGGGDPR